MSQDNALCRGSPGSASHQEASRSHPVPQPALVPLPLVRAPQQGSPHPCVDPLRPGGRGAWVATLSLPWPDRQASPFLRPPGGGQVSLLPSLVAGGGALFRSFLSPDTSKAPSQHPAHVQPGSAGRRDPHTLTRVRSSITALSAHTEQSVAKQGEGSQERGAAPHPTSRNADAGSPERQDRPRRAASSPQPLRRCIAAVPRGGQAGREERRAPRRRQVRVASGRVEPQPGAHPPSVASDCISAHYLPVLRKPGERPAPKACGTQAEEMDVADKLGTA